MTAKLLNIVNLFYHGLMESPIVRNLPKDNILGVGVGVETTMQIVYILTACSNLCISRSTHAKDMTKVIIEKRRKGRQANRRS